MTREEYLQECANSYLAKTYESLDSCDIEFISCIIDAFEAGAKWVDANPKQGFVDLSQVWHDADEEPDPYKDLLVENEKGGHAVNSWYNESYGWKSFAEIFQLRRWAYIEDLLPKRGEE